MHVTTRANDGDHTAMPPLSKLALRARRTRLFFEELVVERLGANPLLREPLVPLENTGVLVGVAGKSGRCGKRSKKNGGNDLAHRNPPGCADWRTHEPRSTYGSLAEEYSIYNDFVNTFQPA